MALSGDLVISASSHDVSATVARLTAGLQRRGIRLFAVIDHAAGAREADLELDDEVLLVFGSPAVGTALMQADPRAGLDLPLRVVVWSQDGRTQLAFRDPARLAADYGLATQDDVLRRLGGLLEELTAEAAG